MCHYNSLGWKIPVNLHNVTEVAITLAEKIITDVPLGPCFQKVLKKYLLRVQSRVLPKCSFPRPKYEDDELNSIFFVVWLTDERHLALFPAGTIVRDTRHRKSWLLSEIHTRVIKVRVLRKDSSK